MMIKTKQEIKRNEEVKMKSIYRNHSTFINKENSTILFLRKSFYGFLSCSLFLFTLSVNLSASSRFDGKLRIAVLDLDARGISKLEVETLSDHLRNEMKRTGIVTPIGPIEIQEMLSKQGFQKTSITSVQWAKEAGKLLGVHQVMKGSLGKIGESYVIDARLFSAETGAIKKTITRVYRGEADGLINEIEKLAWDIAAINQESGKIISKSQSSDVFSTVVANISPTPILTPSSSNVIQRGRIHYPESKSNSNKLQIQNNSLSNKLLSGFGGNSGMLLGGTVLSYLVVKGLITVVSQSSNGKKVHEIGMPPAFPEVPSN